MVKYKRTVEVCFSPELFEYSKDIGSIVVIVDILRATSAICTALANGAKKIIPLATIEEAREYKSKGFMVAAERDGFVLDFADFGNSPFNFTSERVEGKIIAYSTTNGTQSVHLASDCFQVVIGSFLNLQALCKYICNLDRNVIILCAGWKNRFSLEDSVFAGALTESLLQTEHYGSKCDSAIAALDLWVLAKDNLLEYIQKAAQKERLKSKGLDDCLEYCHTVNLLNVVPVFQDNCLVNATSPLMVSEA
jgi:2-phosphosulfolactate phosphatase